jgi:drug/metabolite transporter (DMT)-like permease
MHLLLLSILSSTGIFIVFRSLDKFRIPSFPVIVINYLTASILGFVINLNHLDLYSIGQSGWLPLSVIIGILFIIMFFLVALSSRKAGISVTTVAAKMSVLFPIVFSLIIDPADRLSLIKGGAILCTLSGVTLTVYKPFRNGLDKAVLYIPLILFAGMGLVDSLVKYAQHRFVTDQDTALFSAILFLNAFITGLIILLFTPRNFKSFLRPGIWGWGIILGGVNFGSIFFLVRALNHISPAGNRIDSSVIFGVNNTGIVALSIFVGLWIFRERLLPVNWLGVVLSALALILFALG